MNNSALKQKLTPILRFRSLAILLVVMVVLLVGPGIAASSTIPTIAITGVAVDQTVTIQTYNYPANQNFVVTMGPMGSQGIDGYYVSTINSGNGGSFPATFAIPDQLKGSSQIAIRLQSAQGFFSFNWFYNNTTNTGTGGLPTTPGFTGIPTFAIASVAVDQNVTITTNNFPAGQKFTVTMGYMGTRGINGFVVGELDSAAGGTLTATFPIPAQLVGQSQISIRAQTGHTYPLNPFYAFNWFYNNTAGTGGQPPVPPPNTGYTGIPTFKVCEVAKDGTATIVTNNMPPGQDFTVTMGSMYTAGINGIVVGSYNSGDGSSQRLTFPIPKPLFGSARIAIRAQTAHAYPFFAYNWFFNNTAAVC
ncbi:MAG: hypothetical protein IPJ94_05735 [Chloroflexi bacterium]|nr:hypothetical protein [Chloroflexota bacterium]